MNISKKHKKQLIDDIHYLDSDSWRHILDIIQKNKIKYTENKNGCFVKMNDISNEILIEIIKYVKSNIKKKDDTLNMPEIINSDKEIVGIDKLNLTNYEKSILKKDILSYK